MNWKKIIPSGLAVTTRIQYEGLIIQIKEKKEEEEVAVSVFKKNILRGKCFNGLKGNHLASKKNTEKTKW